MIALLSFSQTQLPSRIILNGDTVICISPDQLKAANSLFLQNNKCWELYDSLNNAVKIYENIFYLQKKDIFLYDSSLTELKLENSLFKKNEEILNKKLKTHKWVIGGSSAMSLVLLTLLIW